MIVIVILLISAMFGLIAFLLDKTNEKRTKNMVLVKGEKVNYYNSEKFGSVIFDDGHTVKIEIVVPRHMVSKIKEK